MFTENCEMRNSHFVSHLVSHFVRFSVLVYISDEVRDKVRDEVFIYFAILRGCLSKLLPGISRTAAAETQFPGLMEINIHRHCFARVKGKQADVRRWLELRWLREAVSACRLNAGAPALAHGRGAGRVSAWTQGCRLKAGRRSARKMKASREASPGSRAIVAPCAGTSM